jgi:hypothetical protein
LILNHLPWLLGIVQKNNWSDPKTHCPFGYGVLQPKAHQLETQ